MRIDQSSRIGVFAVASLWLLAAAPVRAQGGLVKGTVRLPSDSGSVRDTVIYLEGTIGKPTPSAALMDQKNLSFVPHVVPVVVGSSVKFLNSDSAFHSVYSTSTAKKFDLGMFRTGEFRSVEFDTPGVVEVLCNVHPKMQGFVVVVPNDYFTQPDAQGNYQIGGIPAGRYKLRAWHDGLQTAETWVNLEEAKIRDIDLQLKR